MSYDELDYGNPDFIFFFLISHQSYLHTGSTESMSSGQPAVK